MALGSQKQVRAKLQEMFWDSGMRKLWTEKVMRYHGIIESSDETAEGRSTSETNVEYFLRTGVSHEDETKQERRTRQEIERLIASGQLQLSCTPEAADAWVGDRALDFFLSLEGRNANLAPWQLQGISATLFSGHNLSGGLGRYIAEEKEADVGQALANRFKYLLREIRPAMSSIKIPDPTDFNSSKSIESLVARHVEEAAAFAAEEWTPRARKAAVSYRSPETERKPTKKVKSCKMWRLGACRDKELCKFSHIAAEKGVDRKAKQVCKYWSEGTCRQGTNCLYKHSSIAGA